MKLRIEELKKSLEKAKVEAAQQAAADAFYATEQGLPKLTFAITKPLEVSNLVEVSEVLNLWNCNF